MYQDCQRHNNGARLLTLYLKLLQLISAAERIREGKPKVWVPCASGNVSNIKLIMYVARFKFSFMITFMLPARVEFISWGIFPLKMTLTEPPVRDSPRIKWARTEIEIQMLVENKTWG